jgi:hypothetical protein
MLRFRSLGVYRFRLIVEGPRGGIVASQYRSVFAFGSVSLSTLIPDGDADPGTATTAGQTFPYVIGFEDDGSPNPAFGVAGGECRSVSLQLVPENLDGFPPQQPESFTITLVQQTLAPVTVSAPYGQVTTLNAALVPGQPWSINEGLPVWMWSG